MAKDLVRRTDLVKTRSEQTTPGEVERAQLADVRRKLLGGVARPQRTGSPIVLVGLDMTSSLGEYIEPPEYCGPGKGDRGRDICWSAGRLAGQSCLLSR
jgi:hypothetical protein